MNNRAPALVALCSVCTYRICVVSWSRKHVIERAVNDGVEPAFKSVQPGRIGNLEVDLDPGAVGVALGQPNRRCRAVDAGARKPVRRIVDGVMPRTGARVEHLAAQRTVGNQLLNSWLRSADIPRNEPRRRPLVTVECLKVPGGLRCHVSSRFDRDADTTRGVVGLKTDPAAARAFFDTDT
jgi:hypothetical protein